VQRDRFDDLSSDLSKATSDRISREMLLREINAGGEMSMQTIVNSPELDALRKEISAKGNGICQTSYNLQTGSSETGEAE